MQGQVETGFSLQESQPYRELKIEPWTVRLEGPHLDNIKTSIEKIDNFTLVHFDFQNGSSDQYHLHVQQPFIDIHRTWAGMMDCWTGREFTSVGLNFSFETAANRFLPVICNYNRLGQNCGLVGLLNHIPLTRIQQSTVIHHPMRFLSVQFSRFQTHGDFRETLVLSHYPQHFAETIQSFFKLCKDLQKIEPLSTPDWARKPVWCSWYARVWDLTSESIEEQLPPLRELGFGTVIIDAPWFPYPKNAVPSFDTVGDFTPCPERFPDLKGLVRKIHDAGLHAILWCAPLWIGALKKARKKMEPYLVWDGKERLARLCPFCPQSIEHTSSLVEQLMKDYELDGLKIDFMDHVDPVCVDKSHGHQDGDFGQAMNQLMEALKDRILAVNSQAAIEYRVRYSNLVALAHANCHRGNDAPYDGDYQRRENLFLRLFCDHRSAVYSDYAYWHPNESLENISLILGQQIFSGGVPTLSIELTQCNPEEKRVIADWFEFYREHRQSLAEASLTIHSADSCFSITSLQNMKQGHAYLLLTGQSIPMSVCLGPEIKEVWILNASAQAAGEMTITSGSCSVAIRLHGFGLKHDTLK